MNYDYLNPTIAKMGAYFSFLDFGSISALADDGITTESELENLILEDPYGMNHVFEFLSVYDEYDIRDYMNLYDLRDHEQDFILEHINHYRN